MMNRVFFLLSVLAIAACATTKQVSKPNWMHIFDPDGRIAASVDTANGEVVYFQSAEKSFEAAFSATMRALKELEKANAPKVEAPKAKAKQEKKK